MGHVSDVEFYGDMGRYLDAAAAEPVVVDRQHGKPSLVVMSLAEYESWKETNYLLSSPANAERLLATVRRINASGKGPDAAHERRRESASRMQLGRIICSGSRRMARSCDGLTN